MSIRVSDRLQAVAERLGSQAAVADLLGVSPSRVSRWLRRGEIPERDNRRKLEAVEYILTRLADLYEPETAVKWMRGANAHLGHRRPIDLLEAGRVTEVLQAVEAAETGVYA